MTKKFEKIDVMKPQQIHDKDSGSAQAQIALLTYRLKYLGEHLASNKKDHSSRRGLLKIVGKRRKLLKYLHRKDSSAYKQLISDLSIRVSKSS